MATPNNNTNPNAGGVWGSYGGTYQWLDPKTGLPLNQSRSSQPGSNSTPAVNQGPTPPPAPQAGPTQDQINDPNWLATNLGNTWQPDYNSNDKGSFERNFNAALNKLTPDQLIKRYSAGSGINLKTDQDRAGYQAYNSFKSLFGRAPTTNEFSQVLPAFQGPNGAMNGNAALANLQSQYKNNPSLDPNSQQNQQTPQQFQSSVNSVFQQVLNRAPTADELSHFTNMLQTNQMDAYGLAGQLKQSSEYTNAQDTTFRNSLNTQLQNYDVTEFNREKQGIISQYAQNGMPMGASPSLDYALTNLMGQISQNRSAYLANLSASQYGNNKDLAIGNYQNLLNQQYQNALGQRQYQQNYGQQLLGQGFNGADYQTQMKDYYNNMQTPSNNNSLNYMNTAFNGINAGANLFRAYSGA